MRFSTVAVLALAAAVEAKPAVDVNPDMTYSDAPAMGQVDPMDPVDMGQTYGDMPAVSPIAPVDPGVTKPKSNKCKKFCKKVCKNKKFPGVSPVDPAPVAPEKNGYGTNPDAGYPDVMPVDPVDPVVDPTTPPTTPTGDDLTPADLARYDDMQDSFQPRDDVAPPAGKTWASAPNYKLDANTVCPPVTVNSTDRGNEQFNPPRNYTLQACGSNTYCAVVCKE